MNFERIIELNNRTIWVDITTSQQWPGGVVGIVRAELEVAAALNKHYPDVRFSKFDNGSFFEVNKSDLPWLGKDVNIAEAYLEGRGKAHAFPVTEKSISKVEKYLRRLAAEIPSRSRRFQHSLLLTVSSMPVRWQKLGMYLTWLPRKILDAAICVRLLFPKAVEESASNSLFSASGSLSYPYKNGDMVVSLGWLDSGKENYYTKVKERDPNIELVYMVYDTILVGESTHHLYRPQEEDGFRKYFEWISKTCDYILYAGNSPQVDGIAYQEKHSWPVPPSLSIPFGGTDLSKNNDSFNDQEILSSLGVVGPYILTVGTIEVRKNHDTLYKAYVSLIESGDENIPQLVFAGKPGWRTGDLIDTIERDPRVAGKLLLLSPSDIELTALYRNCRFTLLPSFYEGWSLPMPEGLSYGKLCLASDVTPLREIGQEFPVYIHPLDVMGWADKIKFYSHNDDALLAKENNIKNNWKATSWEKCGEDVLVAIKDFASRKVGQKETLNLWFDLTLSYAVWRGGVSGIIRSELILAHYMEKLVPGVKFFGFYEGKFFEIPRDRLIWLFASTDVNRQYATFQKFWNEAEAKGEGHRIPIFNGSKEPVIQASLISELEHVAPFVLSRNERIRNSAGYFLSALPSVLQKLLVNMALRTGLIKKFSSAGVLNTADFSPHKNEEGLPQYFEKLLEGSAQDLPFSKNDMVFSAGINWDQQPLIELIKAKRKSPFNFAQIIYDMTPLITPHLHAKEAFNWYQRFFYLSGLASNKIIYGGETAMRDGVKWQAEHNWSTIPGLPVKFGADIAPQTDHSKDSEMLLEMGVTGPFILSVGTLEIRKNHETLYKAYLKLLEDGVKDIPQMVFVGGAGWKAQDLFEIITRDKRVSGKILILRTSDPQLDVLYRHCQFTLLSSLYEGWSLTLPESLGYGKFCLTSDVDPLRETGRDLVDYIHPWDVVGWAEKIKFYSHHPEALAAREARILEEWKTITWEKCAEELIGSFKSIVKEQQERQQ
ncbi:MULTISPECIES: glycosyltransferase [Pseudomonas]|uniref:glycosyltransferase n=1 Tax=Pseudomonas TaxID=286 RepID=UPI000A1CC365|nr:MULTISPECIES: glycosyltransferase [Pseudomonas]WDG52055.1 glycosyltransferase [Pseudomonas chlororaphis]WDH86928.1 glycosyltransferase [Pseudomonas chlororaphis]